MYHKEFGSQWALPIVVPVLEFRLCVTADSCYEAHAQWTFMSSNQNASLKSELPIDTAASEEGAPALRCLCTLFAAVGRIRRFV
jgi:hypothetical protein